MQFLFCDTGPVAGFISGGSRACKDSGAWVSTAGDKEERKKYEGKAKEEEMSGKSKL